MSCEEETSTASSSKAQVADFNREGCKGLQRQQGHYSDGSVLCLRIPGFPTRNLTFILCPILAEHSNISGMLRLTSKSIAYAQLCLPFCLKWGHPVGY